MKTSELVGPALDWAVAKALGKETWKAAYGGLHIVNRGIYETEIFQPSVKWSQGGPIIERERIDLGIGTDFTPEPNQPWVAAYNLIQECMSHEAFGPTPLIAAMRCYVASKLGDEVDIPEDLK